VLSVAFAIDCHDREVFAWTASPPAAERGAGRGHGSPFRYAAIDLNRDGLPPPFATSSVQNEVNISMASKTPAHRLNIRRSRRAIINRCRRKARDSAYSLHEDQPPPPR
jgi:hypothetical protein